VFQTLMQQEMIRMRKGEPGAVSPLVDKLFKPMGDRMLAVAEEGIRAGELIAVESSQLLYAVIGPNVFYFLSAPLMRLIVEADLLLPAALEFRRRAAIEYLGLVLFIDRDHGARLAAKVLAETPMPQPVGLPSDPFRNLRIEPGNMDAGQSSPKK